MNKTRFTRNHLIQEIKKLNDILEQKNHEYRFVTGGRYNKSAIDLATPEQVKRHTCSINLALGTPKQCLNECMDYMTRNRIDYQIIV